MATKLKRRKANNPPTVWKAADEKILLKYLRKNSNNSTYLKDLFPKRTLPGLRSKVRKLRIKHDLFGSTYRNDKEEFTLKIARKAKPQTVFDAYAGAGHQTFKWISVADKVFASEIMKSKLRQFEKNAKVNGFDKVDSKDPSWKFFKKGRKEIHFFIGDAVDAAADLKVKKVTIDLVDLDTCGSTLPILPTILVLLRPKDLLITHGEFHSMRFKRQDVLRRLLTHKDIARNPLPLEVEEMARELEKAVKAAGLRAHNETPDSFWLILKEEIWLGSQFHGMLRRYYKVTKPRATADCINSLNKL